MFSPVSRRQKLPHSIERHPMDVLNMFDTALLGWALRSSFVSMSSPQDPLSHCLVLSAFGGILYMEEALVKMQDRAADLLYGL